MVEAQPCSTGSSPMVQYKDCKVACDPRVEGNSCNNNLVDVSMRFASNNPVSSCFACEFYENPDGLTPKFRKRFKYFIQAPFKATKTVEQIKTWVQIKFINVQCMLTQLVLLPILIILITHKIHSLVIHSLKITEVAHHSLIITEMLDPADIASKLISTVSPMKIAKVF